MGHLSHLLDLRTIQDWVVRPQLRNIPGVTDVNTIGGYEKQYHVTPYPDKLISYGLSFHDILQALARNNANVGAGYIEHSGEQYLIRAPGQVADIENIQQIIIGNYKGVPIYIKDVAEVLLREGTPNRCCNGKWGRGCSRYGLHAYG